MNACWYVDRADARSAHAARSGALAFLRRGGEGQADFDACALALAELIGNAMRHAPAGPITVKLDWSKTLPRLSVSDGGAGFRLKIGLPPVHSEGGRGLFLIARMIGTPTVCSDDVGCTVSVVLPVRRRAGAAEIKESA